MKPVVNLYKPLSLTPLQAVEEFKKKNSAYKSAKISYPGKLDPMAEGVLVLLVGEENKKMTQYMGLDKEYNAQILLGFETDSYDVLGLAKEDENLALEHQLIKKKLKEINGAYTQTLPAYSSYRINGKSLFHYARTNQLDKIELPKKVVQIRKLKIESIYTITGNKILKQIERKIKNLEGDFRQEEILKRWEELLKSNLETKYILVEVTISCSTGTYIRSIAHDLGKRLDTSAILLNLKRTKVGKYGLRDSVRL
jgi:tRNA pseudouridine55 synthase